MIASAGHLNAIDTYAYHSPLPEVMLAIAAAEEAARAAEALAVEEAAQLPEQASIGEVEFGVEEAYADVD